MPANVGAGPDGTFEGQHGMIGFVGIAIVFVMVFGGYMAAGGKLGIILKSLPFELVMIGGAAVGAFVVGNDMATIKHTHHKFDIDAPGSDTQRHRAAGAAETAIVSGSRVAIIEEIEAAGEPALEAVAARLKPADIILVEG